MKSGSLKLLELSGPVQGLLYVYLYLSLLKYNFNFLQQVLKVKQSRYRPGGAQRVPGN